MKPDLPAAGRRSTRIDDGPQPKTRAGMTPPPSPTAPHRWLGSLLGLPRSTKRLVMLTADVVFIPLVMYLAFALKHDDWPRLLGPPSAGGVALPMLLAVLVGVPIFMRLGLYRAVIRFMGPRAALTVIAGVGLTVATLGLLALALPAGLPGAGSAGLVATASTLVIFGTLLLAYVGASRMLLRWLLLPRSASAARVIIYGAGEGGTELAAALLASREFEPVAFVDDNPALHGSVIAGIRVHRTATLAQLMEDYATRRVLLAMPALSRRARRDILARLEPLGAHVQTMPTIADLVAGLARVDELREIDVADLLGREAVPPDPALFAACIRGKNVLVTGAGGSIGSELCRQIVHLAPARLVLLEMSEFALYAIERELRPLLAHEGLSVELVSLLGNAHHRYRVREILDTFAIETIYHAAAYKHVPIVEENLIEGMHNNVFSTWYTAEAALECGVKTFVLVSTDKAVNPTNVMGATKRLAEIVLQGMQQRSATTRFCMVRFGNVLESSGSVVPLFREQIKHGGPVTVTHPDVIRYFMTIPEAAQLVIQAGAMATGGEVFVLDMGKPVRIADLARRMIQLAGLTVRDQANADGDIEIQYTGLRPAEKLFEELLIGKNVTGTGHPMIMRAVEHSPPWDDVERLLNELSVAMRRFDCSAARQLMQRAVAEYQPIVAIQDRVWVQRREVARAAAAESKVVELRPARHGVIPLPLDDGELLPVANEPGVVREELHGRDPGLR
jgi:FlaA1/EpsC-like NDP-sugar epimerase